MGRLKTELLFEKTYNISNITDEAEMAFWGTVADFVPDAETGDLDPATNAKLRKEMEKAIKVWIKYNTFNKK